MNSDFNSGYTNKKAVSIFASGAGSNAENCMHYFENHPSVYINLIITNNPSAGVIEKAAKHNVPVKIYARQDWENGDRILADLNQNKTDVIVLAGFLQLLPAKIIHAFEHRIINIHPALLPKYGGKGMYGKRVHEAVIGNREIETGITIHEVDEIYDHGKILFQEVFPVSDEDDIQSIEKKIRALEHKYLPLVVEKLCLSLR